MRYHKIMQNDLDFRELFTASRARVYLLWALIVAVGFTATHYYQNPNINAVWTILSIVGFVYMYKVMPLKVSQMKHIFASWLVPIIVGMVFSVVAVRTSLLPELISYLGPFWLAVMAVGYFWNGLVDGPGLWYYVAAAVNLVAAAVIYSSLDLLSVQYLLIAIISTWSMLMLWLFRGDS